MVALPNPPVDCRSADGAISLADFYAVPDTRQFMFMPTRTLWPADSVNGILPPVRTGEKRDGKWVTIKATAWLKQFRRVEQITWVPGEPEIIEDRLLFEGGWRRHSGAHCLNLYLASQIRYGDAAAAKPWLDHLNLLYPDDADDIINWLAHRIQRPGEKINHALLLGGEQGIGKEMLLQPVRRAVGDWNFQHISPTHLLESWTWFVKAVVLYVSEAHDLGDSDRANRFTLYERTKIYAAAPPPVLRCNDKYIRSYYVPNVLGLIITTNHLTDGIYLPDDDRRHFVVWSHITKEHFTAEYFTEMWQWLENGGNEHVAAYLAQRDLSAFNPKALPRQTKAFFDIVAAGRAPEDAELADVLDKIGNGQGQPNICSLLELASSQHSANLDWLRDRKHRRSIPYRMGRNGYIVCRNPNAKSGLWVINGQRQILYAKNNLTTTQQILAANAYVLSQQKVAGSS